MPETIIIQRLGVYIVAIRLNSIHTLPPYIAKTLKIVVLYWLSGFEACAVNKKIVKIV